MMLPIMLFQKQNHKMLLRFVKYNFLYVCIKCKKKYKFTLITLFTLRFCNTIFRVSKIIYLISILYLKKIILV